MDGGPPFWGLAAFLFCGPLMILLYTDESGSVVNPNDYFVVGGVAVHEADVEALRRRVDFVVRRHLLLHQRGLELHAQPIRRGSGPWGRIPRPAKEGLLKDIPALLGRFGSAATHPFSLFAVAKAPNAVPAADPLERTFEELFLRFTEMLIRTGRAGDPNYGIAVADEATYEKVLQPIVAAWREVGVRRTFKRLRTLVEIPLFVDSRATRMIQLADFVAYAVYRHYASGDDRMFGPLLPAFDTHNGVLHGLVHLTPGYRTCACPACISRATARRIEDRLGSVEVGEARADRPSAPRQLLPPR